MPYGPASNSCGLVLDRHVPKNAGTTVRSMLRLNARRGSCEYIGYDMGRTWTSRVGFNHTSLAELTAELNAEPPPQRRLCAEAHMVAGSFWSDLATLRSGSFAHVCRVVVMVRVREPYSWYRSFYDWAARPRQRTGDARWGENFTDWVPPNMQSRYLLHGADGRASEWADELAAKAAPGTSRRLSAAKWATLTGWLARCVDVLAPLERFDDALALLLVRSGLLLSTLAYTRAVPRPVNGPWDRQQHRTARVLSAREFCEADANTRRGCAEAVRVNAPDDFRLHELATRRFAAQWQLEGAAAASAAASAAAADAALGDTVRHASGGKRGGGHGRRVRRLNKHLSSRAAEEPPQMPKKLSGANGRDCF